MQFEGNIPKFDIPADMIAGCVRGNAILDLYRRFPCKIKAGIFIYCTAGIAEASVNLSRHRIQAGKMVIITPECFIQLHNTSPDIELFFAAFGSDFISSGSFMNPSMELLPVIFENPVTRPAGKISSTIEGYMRWLAEGFEGALAGSSEFARGALFMIQKLAEHSYRSSGEWKESLIGRENEIYKDFLRLVFLHYRTEHRVSFYSSALGITLQHFSSTIKKVAGHAPHHIIRQAILMDAKAQLKSTDTPVKDIAQSLGFSNYSFFNKFFRSHVGRTPQQYRHN